MTEEKNPAQTPAQDLTQNQVENPTPAQTQPAPAAAPAKPTMPLPDCTDRDCRFAALLFVLCLFAANCTALCRTGIGYALSTLLLAGASAFPRTIDFERLGAIAKEAGCLFMVDMAHIAGLVAAGLHPSPVPYADVVTTTTHKTLRGPRGGLILTNNAYLIKRINSAIFPGTQGGPLEHVIAAKAVCFGEALKPEFKEYARKIVENAQALAAALQERGVKLVSGGTDNHLMLIDLRDEECTGKDLEARLDSVHITANKNTVPGETRSPFVTSGVRLGTPAVTTRGMGPAEMKVIADCIADCIWHYDEKKDEISDRVLKLTHDFPLYE